MKTWRDGIWLGTMKISPITGDPFYITGEWEYKAEYNCYYCDGVSYPAEICEEVDE